MSKANMLIRRERREGNITKLIQAKRYSNWQSARAATDRCVTGSHAKNDMFYFEYYREGMGALECYSGKHFVCNCTEKCFPNFFARGPILA
jgi:hypothetical protein